MGSLSLSFRQPTSAYLFCVLFLWWSMLSFLYSSVSYTQGQLLGLHLGDPSAQLQRRQWHPTAVLLPRKSHGRRSLKGCSPWGCWRSDTTEQLHFHFSLSCIGEGNGNPLRCSCLENPRDGEAWWAAVYGVAQSRTWLKQLSRSKGNVIGACSQFFPTAVHKQHNHSYHTCILSLTFFQRDERKTKNSSICFFQITINPQWYLHSIWERYKE